MIHDDWTTKCLAEVADYKAGRTPARANSEYWADAGEGVPWVAISDMSRFGIVSETKEKIAKVAFNKIFRGRAVPAGTLLMSYKLTIGRVATLGVDACHNEAIISIYPKPGIDQRYLGYFLAQVDYEDLQDRQIKGNTLNREKIDRIEIRLPPTSEQASIADVLDLARRAVDIQEQALANAQDLKRVTMLALFTRGLKGETQKETEIGPVPQSWRVIDLGSLGRIGNGSTPKKMAAPYWEGGTHPWLTSGKVYERQIFNADQFVTDLALAECHLPRLQRGTVVVAITGQGKTLGHCAVLGIDATINQHLAYIALDPEKADSFFIRGYLETQYAYLRQVGAGGGSTKGALTCGFLRRMQVPLPPLTEQVEIVSILDVIDRKIDWHRKKRAMLDDLFRALLHELMAGEIHVADLDLTALAPDGKAEAAA